MCRDSTQETNERLGSVPPHTQRVGRENISIFTLFFWLTVILHPHAEFVHHIVSTDSEMEHQ